MLVDMVIGISPKFETLKTTRAETPPAGKARTDPPSQMGLQALLSSVLQLMVRNSEEKNGETG